MTEHEYLASDEPQRILSAITHPHPNLSHPLNGYKITDRKLRLFATGCCRLVWDGTPCERCGGTGCRESGYVKCGGPLEGIRDNRRTVNCPDCHGSGRIGGLTDPRSRRAVVTAEAFAEGWATGGEMQAACEAAQDLPHALHPTGRFDIGLRAATAAAWAAADSPVTTGGANAAANGVISYLPEFAAVQAARLRSIVGNPFQRPPKWKFCPGDATTWCTPNVLSLAAAIQGGEECSACWNTYLKQNCTLCFGLGRTPFVSDPAAWAVLGDALEEAGVTDLAILNHCRGLVPCVQCSKRRAIGRALGAPVGYCSACHPNAGWRPSPVPHVRGDWVIDLLTGKE